MSQRLPGSDCSFVSVSVGASEEQDVNTTAVCRLSVLLVHFKYLAYKLSMSHADVSIPTERFFQVICV